MNLTVCQRKEQKPQIPQWPHSRPVKPAACLSHQVESQNIYKGHRAFAMDWKQVIFSEPWDRYAQAHCYCQGIFHNLFWLYKLWLKHVTKLRKGKKWFLESTRSLPWILKSFVRPLACMKSCFYGGNSIFSPEGITVLVDDHRSMKNLVIKQWWWHLWVWAVSTHWDMKFKGGKTDMILR